MDEMHFSRDMMAGATAPVSERGRAASETARRDRDDRELQDLAAAYGPLMPAALNAECLLLAV